MIRHYLKLLYFTFNRFKGDNYRTMREYFCSLFICEIEKHISLEGSTILDVGGACGEFCRVLNENRTCNAINIDPYPDEALWAGTAERKKFIKSNSKTKKDKIWPGTAIGFADRLPFENNRFDLVICRGVLEHIETGLQQKSLSEMFRVLKSGTGLCYILIPPWFNPHAGHQLKPFHYFPFRIAKFLRHIFFRNRIEDHSYAEARLYPITFRKMQKMIFNSGFRLLETRDFHFRMHFLTKIPVLREILVPSVAFILRKP